MVTLGYVVNDLLKYIFPMVGIMLFVGLVSWPTYSYFFRNLWDRGIALSISTSWILLAYLYFLIALITGKNILTLRHTLYFLLIWTLFNIFLFFKNKYIRSIFDVKTFVRFSVGFLLTFLLIYLVKGHVLDSIFQERVMEFGITNALFNTDHLPLTDFWMAGEKLNYYYFGHFISYIYLQYLHIPVDPGIYVVSINLVSSIFLAAYYLGNELAKSFNTKKSYLGGLLSVFFVGIAGTIDTIPWLITKLTPFNVASEIYSYDQTSRLIPATIFLHPFRLFLEFDLHSQTWNILTLVVLLILLWVFIKQESYKLLIAICITLSFSLLLHPWDYPFMTFLTATTIVYKNKSLFRGALVAAVVAYAAQVLVSPFYASYINPLNGLDWVKYHSGITPWLVIWLVFVAASFWSVVSTKQKDEKAYFWILLTVSLLALLSIEIFFLKDVNMDKPFNRFNTFYKVACQVWVTLAISSSFAFFKILHSKNNLLRLFTISILLILSVHSMLTINFMFRSNEFKGLRYTDAWWQKKYPYDYEAFEYLKKKFPRKSFTIMEANGKSYTRTNLFSAFLGWNSVLGWEEHEKTWRDNTEEIKFRQNVIDEFYLGTDPYIAQDIIDLYKIDFVVLGQVERQKYKDSLNYEKIIGLGEVEFFNNQNIIVRTSSR